MPLRLTWCWRPRAAVSIALGDGGKTWGLLLRLLLSRLLGRSERSAAHRPGPGRWSGSKRSRRIDGRWWPYVVAGLDRTQRRRGGNTMVERFTQVGDELIAVLSNGELFSASVSRMEWQRILPTVNGVAAVAEFAD